MHDSFSSRTLLLLAALAAAGCATTPTLTGKRTLRGPMVGREEAPPVDTDRLYLAVKDAGAELRIARRRCVTTRTTYRKVSEETYKGSRLNGRGSGMAFLLMAAGGGAALLANEAVSDESLRETATYGAVGIALGGLVGILMDPPRMESVTSRRTVPLAETEQESSTKCGDLDLRAPGPVPFTFAMEGQSVEGQTDDAAQLALVSPSLRLLQRFKEDDRVIGMVIADRSLKARLAIGTASPKTITFSTRFLPDSFFEEIAARYEARLTGSARSRWENCKAIGRSLRENLECHLQP